MTLSLPQPVAVDRRVVGALGAALAAGILCGIFVHTNAFVWVVAVGLVLGLGVTWPWLVVRLTTATLRLPRNRGREGETVEAVLTVTSRLPWRIKLRLEGIGDGRDVATGETALRWVPGRFGAVPGGVRLACDRSFGLWTARRAVAVAKPMIVWPATHPVGPVPDVGGESTGIHAGRRVGVGGEMCGVRDFRPGDRLRLMHWAQSAKHNRLIVRETLADATPTVKIGLKLARQDHADAEAFDQAIRHAASMVEGWTKAGSTVELVLGDRRIGCPPNAVPRAAVDALAVLKWEELPESASVAGGVDVWAHDLRHVVPRLPPSESTDAHSGSRDATRRRFDLGGAA